MSNWYHQLAVSMRAISDSGFRVKSKFRSSVGQSSAGLPQLIQTVQGAYFGDNHTNNGHTQRFKEADRTMQELWEALIGTGYTKREIRARLQATIFLIGSLRHSWLVRRDLRADQSIEAFLRSWYGPRGLAADLLTQHDLEELRDQFQSSSQTAV
jgi:hypothetical protein